MKLLSLTKNIFLSIIDVLLFFIHNLPKATNSCPLLLPSDERKWLDAEL